MKAKKPASKGMKEKDMMKHEKKEKKLLDEMERMHKPKSKKGKY